MPPRSCTIGAMALTTGGPMVMLGTKWPSMTSTWMTPGAGVHDLDDLLLQAAEVGRQDGGRDVDLLQELQRSWRPILAPRAVSLHAGRLRGRSSA